MKWMMIELHRACSVLACCFWLFFHSRFVSFVIYVQIKNQINVRSAQFAFISARIVLAIFPNAVFLLLDSFCALMTEYKLKHF